jgi:hypothetical protein
MVGIGKRKPGVTDQKVVGSTPAGRMIFLPSYPAGVEPFANSSPRVGIVRSPRTNAVEFLGARPAGRTIFKSFPPSPRKIIRFYT